METNIKTTATHQDEEMKRKIDLMNVNELSVKDEECRNVLADTARKIRLIAAKKKIRYGACLLTN